MSRYEDMVREAEEAAKGKPNRYAELMKVGGEVRLDKDIAGMKAGEYEIIAMAKGEIQDRMPGANKTERAYGDLLARREADGLILRWWWQPASFRLATMENGYGDFYRPDFMVQLPDGSIEIHETKGFMRADSQSKLKLFACIYPFALFVAKKAAKRDGGAFTLTRYRGSLP